jgi:hypothetical protein
MFLASVTFVPDSAKYREFSLGGNPGSVIPAQLGHLRYRGMPANSGRLAHLFG